MMQIKTHARAVADVIDGLIVASVEIERTPDRVFQALTTREIVDWWVNPGVRRYPRRHPPHTPLPALPLRILLR